jgi:glycosyltransferase involved in cell wall biosynthesis
MDAALKNILEQVERLIGSGDLDAAHALLRDSQPRYGEDPEWLNSLGVTLFQKGSLAEAVEILGRAIQADPANPDIIHNLVQIHVRLGRPEEAIGFLDSLPPGTLCESLKGLKDELHSLAAESRPMVSIIIPSFNQAAFLPSAIRSALSQEGVSKEILIVDDGSTDETRQLALTFSGPQVKYIPRPNGGEAAASNTGIRESRGEYLFWLDADDELAPESLCKLFSLLKANPKALYACSDILLMDEHGNPTGKIWEYKEFSREFLVRKLFEEARSPLPGRASTMVRRSTYERFGLFNDDLRIATDTEFLARLLISEDFKTVHVAEPLYRYRISYRGLLKDPEQKHRACLSIHEKVLTEADPELIVPDMVHKRLTGVPEKYWAELASAFACERLWRMHREFGKAETYRFAAIRRLEACKAQTPDASAIGKTLDFLRHGPRVETRPSLGIFAPNAMFITGTARRLEGHFHVVFFDTENPKTMAENLRSCDAAWFEWCEAPLVAATSLPTLVPILCRLHSYEAFQERPAEVDWRRVDRLVFVSDKVRDLFCRYFHVDHKAVTIPNGLDLSRYRIPKDKRYGKKVAYVGSISYKKGPQMLLQCFKAIHEQDPEYTFHVAGDFHEIRSRLYFMDMLPRLNIPVNFYGHVEDIPGWLKDKDFILSTSLFESFQYAVAEGIACGLMPLVHSWPGSEGTYPERSLFATAGECAALVKRYEKEDRFQLAESFQGELQRRFDLDTQAREIKNLIQETIEERRRSPEIVITRKSFLTHHHLPKYIEGKIRRLRSASLDKTVRKVLIHTPPSGGFRYYAENLYCAFSLLGFDVRHLLFTDRAAEEVARFHPDLLITACSPDYLRRLPLERLAERAASGKTVRLVWAETFKPLDGLHEMNSDLAQLVQTSLAGDIFFSPVDESAVGEEYSEWKALGYRVHSIPMAANPIVHLFKQSEIQYDIGFIGTNSPAKRRETDTYLMPLMERYSALLQGDRWGKGILPLPQNRAGAFYGKVRICPNFHHSFQKRRQLQLNERTFVVPSCGGFEIVDETPILRKYFSPDEMVQASTVEEWFSLHEEWLWKDQERVDMAARAHSRVLAEHTYFERVFRMLELVRDHRGS